MRISLAMITKNEAETLGRALDSARPLCDEIIIVDTGSTDDTVAIAESKGARVYHHAWQDDFSAPRNASFRHCSGDWILWLDADDVIPFESLALLQALKDVGIPDDIDAVEMNYNYIQNETGAWAVNIPRERLIRANAEYHWQGLVYEYIDVPKPCVLQRHDIAIHHFPTERQMTRKEGRNIRLLQKSIDKGDRHPRTHYYLGLELLSAGRFQESNKVFTALFGLPDTRRMEKYNALVFIAQNYFQLNDPGSALSALTQAMLFDTEEVEAYLEIADYFMKNNAWQKAIPLLKLAVQLDIPPDDGYRDHNTDLRQFGWRPLFMISQCYGMLGQRDVAINYIQQALQNPDNTERETHLAFLRQLEDPN